MEYKHFINPYNLLTTLLVIFFIYSTSVRASQDDPHAHHRMMMENQDKYHKSYSLYDLPAHNLKDQNGESVNLHDFLHAKTGFNVSNRLQALYGAKFTPFYK